MIHQETRLRVTYTYPVTKGKRVLYLYPMENGQYERKNAAEDLKQIDPAMTYDKINHLITGRSVKDWKMEKLQAEGVNTAARDQTDLSKYEQNDPLRARLRVTFTHPVTKKIRVLYLYPMENGQYDRKNAAEDLKQIDPDMTYAKINHLINGKSVKDWKMEKLQADGVNTADRDQTELSKYEKNDPSRARLRVTYTHPVTKEKRVLYLYPMENGKYDIKNAAEDLKQIDPNMTYDKISHLINGRNVKNWKMEKLQADGVNTPARDQTDLSKYEQNDPLRARLRVTYTHPVTKEKRVLYLYPMRNGKYDRKNAAEDLKQIDPTMTYNKISYLISGENVKNWEMEELPAEEEL